MARAALASTLRRVGKAAAAPRSERGATLVEVLLAVTVAAAGSALVVATLPAPEPGLAREARLLAARLATAADEAVISGRPIGVEIDEAGYAFRRRDAGEWRPIADDPSLAARAWPTDVAVSVALEGAGLDGARLADLPAQGFPAEAAPVGRFDPTGSASALSLRLEGPDGAWRVSVGVDGVVSLASAEEG